MYPKKQDEAHRGWFVVGAVTLSGIAGFTNSAMFQFGSFAVSHITGSITRVSVELSERDYSSIVPFAVMLLSFFAGAALSGSVVGDKELGVGRRYAVMLLIEGALLAMASSLATRSTATPALGLAAMACGLQNALASSFRGMVVRTTHMTGLVTDLGFQVGKYLRTGRMDRGLLTIHLPIVVSFTGGGVVGAFVHARLGPRSLFFAAGASALAGAGYFVLRRRGVV